MLLRPPQPPQPPRPGQPAAATFPPGCRAPFLLHDEQGRNALQEAGFLYDSSIPDNVPSKISPSLEQRSWPYRMDQGIPQDCDTGEGGCLGRGGQAGLAR